MRQTSPHQSPPRVPSERVCLASVYYLNPQLATDAEYPGTRSVLTLSREQLERKRANDREAQRAIRARTKDYIERLESELREFKDTQREKLIEELQARNKALQEEVWRLQRSHGITADSSPYQSAGMTADPESGG